MRALTPLEVEWLEDACIVLTQEELETDVDSVGPESQAVADNLVARGLAIEDPVYEVLSITPLGRMALRVYYAFRMGVAT